MRRKRLPNFGPSPYFELREKLNCTDHIGSKKLGQKIHLECWLAHKYLASHFWDIGKQSRPRSDAAENSYENLL